MATQSKKVFIEADVWYSFVNRADEKHMQAAAFFRFFAQEKYQTFTSYPVIEEVYSNIYKNISPSLAKDFLRGLSLSSVNILYPNEADLKAALKTLINYQNTELTLKESQTAALAYRNFISQICTFSYLHPLFGQTAFTLPF
jgi:predicted nucleic acid-binding protein